MSLEILIDYVAYCTWLPRSLAILVSAFTREHESPRGLLTILSPGLKFYIQLDGDLRENFADNLGVLEFRSDDHVWEPEEWHTTSVLAKHHEIECNHNDICSDGYRLLAYQRDKMYKIFYCYNFAKWRLQCNNWDDSILYYEYFVETDSEKLQKIDPLTRDQRLRQFDMTHDYE